MSKIESELRRQYAERSLESLLSYCDLVEFDYTNLLHVVSLYESLLIAMQEQQTIEVNGVICKTTKTTVKPIILI